VRGSPASKLLLIPFVLAIFLPVLLWGRASRTVLTSLRLNFARRGRSGRGLGRHISLHARRDLSRRRLGRYIPLDARRDLSGRRLGRYIALHPRWNLTGWWLRLHIPLHTRRGLSGRRLGRYIALHARWNLPGRWLRLHIPLHSRRELSGWWLGRCVPNPSGRSAASGSLRCDEWRPIVLKITRPRLITRRLIGWRLGWR
jgi:hypothetical protein